jgi:NAD(P)-dependent dehydrogenase (short-subunit alcohol dehydrogenase family)
MTMFEGKTVAVVGAGRGLGREVAEVAIREGARVALGARSVDVIQAMAKDLDPSGERVMAHGLDVVQRDQCDSFAAAVADRFGAIHSLVDVAAFDAAFGGLDGADWDQWHQVMEINLFGAMYVVQAALPYFPEDGGAVVFVGSQTMYMPPPAVPQMAYSASKAAVIGAMRHMAMELGRRKIRVNNVAPGWMWGPAVEAYVQMTARSSGLSEDEVRGGITRNLPLGEMATDGDVAETVMFLASDRARGITGQSLLVNAGEFMQ